MKLITYDVSCSNRSATMPIITVSPKSGYISFSRGACESMDLNKGDKVLVHQDQDAPSNWFVEKTNKENGIKVRKPASSNGLMFSNSYLVKKILYSLGRTETTRIPVGSRPDENGLWSLITKAVK